MALVSQSGNVAVNALATTPRAAPAHGRLLRQLGRARRRRLDRRGRRRDEAWARSPLYLEADGDGARLCEALAACADRGVGVVVLKAGSSDAGAPPRRPTPARSPATRVCSARSWRRPAASGRGPARAARGGQGAAVPAAAAPGARTLGILTCSGGDSAPPPTTRAHRLALPALGRRRVPAPRGAARRGAVEPARLHRPDLRRGGHARATVLAVGRDPAIDQRPGLYDQPVGIEGAPRRAGTGARRASTAAAAGSPVPVMVASTLPELLDDDAGARFADAGIPAIAGLRTGLVAAAALRHPPADAAAAARDRGRRREQSGNGASCAGRARGQGAAALRGRAGGRGPPGRRRGRGRRRDRGPRPALVAEALGARADAQERARALALDLRSADDVRAAYRRLVALAWTAPPCSWSAWSRPAWSC